MHTTIRRRFRAAALTASLPIALIGVFGLQVPAQATVIGELELVLDSGDQDTVLDANTSAACPTGSEFLKIEVNGPGIAADSPDKNLLGVTLLSAVSASESGGYFLQLTEKFIDLFQANNVTAPDGIYTLRAVCLDDAAFGELGDMSTQVEFTPNGTSFSGTWVQLNDDPEPTATTTTLTTTPTDPIKAGSASTLTAAVSPSDAAGTVQFKRSGANLGAPVAVTAGVATASRAVPTGAGSLTAVFIPTDDEIFAPSTSAVANYLVVGKPSVTGQVKVGRTVTCAVSAGGTQTFAWLKAGKAQPGFAKRTAAVPASWYNASIACRATVTSNGHSLVQSSAAKKVGVGAKLVAKQKPTLKGMAKVGHNLSCQHGTWAPHATAYKYTWLRNGKLIRGATKATYKVVQVDKRKSISCRVTATSKGYASGLATSKVVKVS